MRKEPSSHNELSTALLLAGSGSYRSNTSCPVLATAATPPLSVAATAASGADAPAAIAAAAAVAAAAALGLCSSTMQAGCLRTRLWMKAMAASAPEGGADRPSRAIFLAKAATV